MIQRGGGRVNDLLGRLTRVLDLDGLPTWTALAYSNNWTEYGSGWAAGAWFKDPSGVVHLRGLIKRSSGAHVSSETIATLPVNCRPLLHETFNQRAASGTFRIDVTSSGTIVIIDDLAGSGAPDTWLSLSGITFRTS